MADTTIQADEVITDDNQQQNNQAATPDATTTALQNAMWGDPEDNNQQQSAANTGASNQHDQSNHQSSENNDVDTFDEADYLKKNFEVDNVDAIKAERDELKKLREQKPQELKFENDFSDKLFKAIQSGKVKEVTQMLRQQEELESIASAEVTKENAEDIIKMNMRIKNPDLSKAEIDFQFEQEYMIPREPKEPKQRATETDDEFEERMGDYNDAKVEWKRISDNIDMRKSIAAKMAKPDLDAAKSKIVFPELQQGGSASKPTQEDLDNYKREQDAYTKVAESTLNDLKGFATQVKNKDVDFSVDYALSQEDKAATSRVINQFIKDGYNSNAIFVERWVAEDGTLNMNQLVKDVSRIYAGDKAEQKIANDAANKMLERYIASKKNINLNSVNNNNQQIQGNDAKTQSERLQEQFWGA